MIRIGSLTFEGNIKFGQKTIAIIVPSDISDSDISLLKTATLLEIVNGEEITGSYHLESWLSIEKLWNGLLFTWQTVSQDEVDILRNQVQGLLNSLNNTNQDLSNLRTALQDLANKIDAGDYSAAQDIINILLGEDEPEAEAEGE